MEGLWLTNFIAGPAHGSGIVILRAGEIMGGDLSHTYRGTWQEDGANLNARIRVESWRAHTQPQDAPSESPFEMTLRGSCTDQMATLSGHPDEKPDLLISIEMKRAA